MFVVLVVLSKLLCWELEDHYTLSFTFDQGRQHVGTDGGPDSTYRSGATEPAQERWYLAPLRELTECGNKFSVILQPFGCFLGNLGSFFVVRYSRNASTTGFVP